MAIMLERTVADDITDALTALDNVERYVRDVRAHLDAARRQTDPKGTLAQADRVAGTVAALATGVLRTIDQARYRADRDARTE